MISSITLFKMTISFFFFFLRTLTSCACVRARAHASYLSPRVVNLMAHMMCNWANTAIAVTSQRSPWPFRIAAHWRPCDVWRLGALKRAAMESQWCVFTEAMPSSSDFSIGPSSPLTHNAMLQVRVHGDMQALVIIFLEVLRECLGIWGWGCKANPVFPHLCAILTKVRFLPKYKSFNDKVPKSELP